MKKSAFLNELKELLEIDESNFLEDAQINLTSIEILSVMVFIDENFNKQIPANDLKSVRSPKDLMILIGLERFDQ
jgi:acyl carrier protein